jgi:cell division septum initiation protein DivIVA
MLFDLRGRRRRAVQATYLTLAVLMGGGLVLFGIGGDVSGGLFDAFSDRSGGSADSQLEERIDRLEDRLQANPQSEATLKALVRDYHAAAGAELPSGSVEYPDEAKDELQEASRYWQRYLEVEDGEPDASLARLALAIYDPTALDQPKEAVQAMSIVAEAANDYESYLALVQRAGAAGDKRTADLAAQKAVDLAPKQLRKQVKQQAEQLKTPVPTEQAPAPQEQAPAPPEQTPEQ